MREDVKVMRMTYIRKKRPVISITRLPAKGKVGYFISIQKGANNRTLRYTRYY